MVFAGVGIPLLAATLAQRLHAPGLTILFEGGTIGAFIEPGKLPPSTNEQRCTRRANMVLGSTDVLLLLQRGYVDIGFMGGAQIDQYGNLNSSFIGDPEQPEDPLPGTGGGNDIASLTQMIVAMKHEKRRFVERVDFVTSPGFLAGGASRHDAGLMAGGMFRVVTDLGIVRFRRASKRMRLLALHPGVTADEVQANTGFELLIDGRSAGHRSADRERARGAAAPRPRPALHGLKVARDDDFHQHLRLGDAELHDLAGAAGSAGADRLCASGRRRWVSILSGCGITSFSASTRRSRSSTR